MSRHYYDLRHDDGDLRVTLGYDRPTDEFFLQIERRQGPDRLPTFVYTSLADSHDQPHNLSYYRAQLIGLRLIVPMSLFDAVLSDAHTRRGNCIIEHLADGTQRIHYDDRDATS